MIKLFFHTSLPGNYSVFIEPQLYLHLASHFTLSKHQVWCLTSRQSLPQGTNSPGQLESCLEMTHDVDLEESGGVHSDVQVAAMQTSWSGMLLSCAHEDETLLVEWNDTLQ